MISFPQNKLQKNKTCVNVRRRQAQTIHKPKDYLLAVAGDNVKFAASVCGVKDNIKDKPVFITQYKNTRTTNFQIIASHKTPPTCSESAYGFFIMEIDRPSFPINMKDD